ncbi:MAG TPA: S9 family peptidase [Gemmatimonadaceae bacterium]|nr:S9 family peptidase [Gemmatimonadaceae bacterium]
MRARIISILAAVVMHPLTAAAQTRGITPEDYFSFELLSDPRISPDGSRVAYVVSRVDRTQNSRVPSIWVAPTDGSAPARVVIGETWSPSAPRWSADGTTIEFVSARASTSTGASANGNPASAGRAQLWQLRLTDSTPRRVSNIANGVSSCAPAPTGDRAVCLSRTGPSDRQPQIGERTDTRHYSRIAYKFNDIGWYDDRRSHLWVIDLTSGSATQITDGDDWNDTDPQWSPDGTRIAFVSDRTGHEYDLGRNTDVWTVAVTGGSLTKISTGSGPDNQPRWSPDGKSIAFVSSPTDNGQPQIYVAPSAGGRAVAPDPTLDLIPTDLQWSGDGASLYFDAGVKGEFHVFRIDRATQRLTQVTMGARAIRGPSIAAKGTAVAYLVNDFTHLDDVYAAHLDSPEERKLSNHNAALWSTLALAPVQHLTFKGADGWDIDGFLVKPINWQPNRKYPLVLSIHGGPAGQYGLDWFHEFQIYAARGWAVFFTNPRGSTGYGHAFQRGIEKEWGGKDYVDIMNGIDAVIAQNPWIDTTHMGVTGGSYGGYMTNWIVGHTSRFAAAVTLRGISNFISDDGTRDAAYGHGDDFGGDIFENFQLYWERSPLKYARNVTTPILILHSDNDYRVPIEQGEQWFRALKHYGKTAEIVFFPRENHNLTRTGEPKHLVESLNWQVRWFEKYLDARRDPGLPAYDREK